MADKIKVTLTGARPVNVDPEVWPVLASADYRWHDNQYEFQANRRKKHDLKVRQHANGCTLVYGTYNYGTQFQGEEAIEVRGGFRLAPGGDLIAAILRVAADMEVATAEAGAKDEDARRWRTLARECVADLPAEEIGCEAIRDEKRA